jgi:AhpD family alkylhydroperoxidase
MTDEKKEERIQNLKEVMKKERGYSLPQWDYVAEKDVDFMEAYNNLYKSSLADGKALSAKTRELIAIALLAYRGLDNDVYNHAKRALRLGATKEEILEAVETSIIPGGAPTFSSGLKALMRIEEDEKKGK